MNTTPSDTMSPAEAATYLGFKRQYIYNLISRGELPYSKFRGRVLLYRRELDAWRMANTIHHPSNEQLASRAAAEAITRKRTRR